MKELPVARRWVHGQVAEEGSRCLLVKGPVLF